MSTSVSPSTGCKYGIQRVCRVWQLPKSSVYFKKKRRDEKTVRSKRGPKPRIPDEKLTESIRIVIGTSKFTGEGHRKVWARLRRSYGITVGKNRVLRLMRETHLLSPHRTCLGKAKTHDGRIVTDAPNDMWATDAVKIWTEKDGWVWYFGVTDHWNSECVGWHVAKRGDRFAALEALRSAVRNGCGSLIPGIARGISLRPDHGSVFTAKEYRDEARHWGFGFSYALVGEPETNGVEERFHRTMKEQCIYGRIFTGIEEVRVAIAQFIEDYNSDWLLSKTDYLSPREARERWNSMKEA